MFNLQIIGNLGRDPETKTTKNGTNVCTFTVAVKRWNGNENVTEWVRVAVFGKRAESCSKYLVKGSSVYVSGTPSANGYQNKEGESVASLELMANEIEFLGKPSNQGEKQEQSQPTDAGFVPVDNDDELPF